MDLDRLNIIEARMYATEPIRTDCWCEFEYQTCSSPVCQNREEI